MQFEDLARTFNRLHTEVCAVHGISDSPWPRIILNTAQADLERYRERQSIQSARATAKMQGLPSHALGKLPAMAFLPSHVRGARCVSDVLRKAIAGRLQGCDPKKPTSTRQIYERATELTAALEMLTRLERETGVKS